jgi:hypothetical protein
VRLRYIVWGSSLVMEKRAMVRFWLSRSCLRGISRLNWKRCRDMKRSVFRLWRSGASSSEMGESRWKTTHGREDRLGAIFVNTYGSWLMKRPLFYVKACFRSCGSRRQPVRAFCTRISGSESAI